MVIPGRTEIRRPKKSETCLAISEVPDMISEGPRIDLYYVSHCLRDWGTMLEVPRSACVGNLEGPHCPSVPLHQKECRKDQGDYRRFRVQIEGLN